MSVRLVVAVTDRNWFEYLRNRADLTEVNFWSPAARPFRALEPGEFFLFKLRSPINKVVGGGVYAYANTLPLGLAWEAFKEGNGANTLDEMRDQISRYRQSDGAAAKTSFEIGCRILTQPFYLPESEWFDPPGWSPNIVSFRTYSTADSDGAALWEALVSARSLRNGDSDHGPGFREALARYGEPSLVHPRLGQGTFRVLITDIYRRRCAITGERTLPALDAAHIRPYSSGGEHVATNGILMRRDIHSLFDAGYVTITTDYRFDVSRRIRDEFENGRHYYDLHGTQVALPDRDDLRPDPKALQWHNDQRFMR